MQSDLSEVKNLLERALGSLRELKAWFLKEAEVKWEGEFPGSLLDDDCMELDGKVGKLRIWRHTKAYLFEFVIETGERMQFRRPLGRDVSEAWWDYEEMLFSIWPYDGVMSKWKNEDRPQWHGELPEWHIDAPSFAERFEHFACEAEQSLIPLAMREGHKALCARAMRVIRNGLPKWQMCVVQWTYVKELDEVIKEVEVALEKTKEDVGAKAGRKDAELRKEQHKIQQQHNDFLRKVAKEVSNLILIPGNRDHFQKQIENLSRKVEEHQRELEQIKKDYEANCELKEAAKKIDEQIKNAPADERLPSDTESELHLTGGLGMLENFQDYMYYAGGFWGPQAQTVDLVYCLERLLYLTHTDFVKKPNESEKMMCSYALLSAIHDDFIKERPIFFDEWHYDGHPQHWVVKIKRTYDCFSAMYGGYYDSVKNTQDWIRRNLDYVKYDLASRLDVDFIRQESKTIDGQTEEVEAPKTERKARRWEELTIEVVDDDVIRYRTKTGTFKRANYTDLGFIDRRKNLENKLWPIFLSLAENNLPPQVGRLSFKGKDIDRICRTLRKFFGIDDRPIIYDKKAKEYKIKFNYQDPRDLKAMMENEIRED